MPGPELLSAPPRSEPVLGTRNRRGLSPVVYDLGRRYRRLERWSAGLPDSALVEAFPSSWGTTVVRVHAGFVWDGASIPGVAEWIAGDRRRYAIAALLHDALYRYGAPRDVADAVFRVVATAGEDRVHPVRAWFSWSAVRAFGWWAHWRNRRRRDRA